VQPLAEFTQQPLTVLIDAVSEIVSINDGID
jgi:hypothetical protein